MRDWITSLYRSLSLLFAAASTTLGLTLTCAGTLALLVALLVTPRPVLAAPASEPARALPGVPAELAPWIEWVRELELPAGDCREVEDATICVWPGRLALQAGEQGASFELDVTAFNRELVTLPGDDAAWPQDVRVDGKPAVVRDGAEEAAGAPTVELAVGRHRVSGRFIWPERPDTLAVPDEIALVELELAGQRVAIPERVDGLLTLALPGAPPRAEEPEEPATQEPAVDSERLEVSRWLRDGVPLTITTRLDLHVSGKPRAITLPYPLWDDVELLRIDSSLPLRLGEERALVVQARAGSHTITLEAALPRAPEQLGPPELPAPWPAEEVWVWRAAGAGEAALGQVAVTGGLAVDRSRTHAPEAWDGGATFQVRATSPLAFEVLQRGVSETAPNELSLRREMRPIMAGAGWTVRDEIEGALHQSTRLDLQAGALGSAIVNDRPQVVTEGPGGATGVELREPSIRLLGTWRSEQLTRTLPLGGWSETFDRVTLEFWLPRGWDVLRIDGPGKGSRTWLESWRALDLLALLGVCVLLGRLLSPWVGGVALLGLGLAYTSRGDGYLMLLALVALLAGLPTLTARARESAWLRRGLWLGWGLCAALLTIWILWGVPQQVHGVWLERESALDAYGLERELTEVLGVALTLWLALGVITGVAWFIGHARVPGRVVVIPAVALAGFAALLLFVQADAPMTDARPTAAYWEAGAASNKDEEPPPEELENLSDDEAGGQGQRHRGEEGRMGKPSSKQKSGLYAMKGPKDAIPTMARDDVWSGEEKAEAPAFGAPFSAGGDGDEEGTIGLGELGLIGKGGADSGYGRGAGAGFGGRGARVPQVRQGKANVQGALDRDIIRRIVRAHINEVRHCYNEGLARAPELAGRVTVQFTITGVGKVGASVVEESTLGDSVTGSCIAKAVKRWQFPKPRGGGNVVVSYPFTLSGGDGAGGGDDGPQRFVSEGELPKPPPSAVPQTGEGTPSWSGRSWTVQLDRAVQPEETVRLWLVPPAVSKALALLRALALALLGYILIARGLRARSSTEGDATRPGARATATATVAALLVALAPGLARAAPPAELLEQLKERVEAEAPLAPSPECHPDCALVSRLEVRVAGDTLTLRAEVHMAGPGVYRVPGSFDSWIPRLVRVDQKPTGELVARDGALLVRLDEGVRAVELSGPIGRAQLNLDLAGAPKRVDVSADGWEVEGVDEQGRADSLRLTRAEGARAGAPREPDPAGEEPGEEDELPAQDVASQELPTWLSVHRQIEIGPRWTARTTVTRLNHGPSPVQAQVPLLPGEKLLEASGKIDEPRATISLETAGSAITWTSVIEPSDALTLEAPVGSPWTETWSVTCGRAWQCGIEGVPATFRAGGTAVYHPWPGESLRLALFKPPPSEGALLAIDQAELDARIAEAASEATLVAQVRTATVTTRTLTLPDGARVGAVKLAGVDVPVAKDAAELRLTFQPGVQELRVEWKQDRGLSWIVRAPQVALGGVAVNARVNLTFNVDGERVILAAGGDGVGPFVWLWPWFGALALLSLALGRARLGPVRHWQWFLLAIGVPFGALPIVVGWFFALHARARWSAKLRAPVWYNALQLTLILWSLLVCAAAILTCHALLTDSVSTRVTNWAAYGQQLSWYVDRTADVTPAGWALTVPESLWRGLWALWVIWLAWQSLYWARWAWAALSAGGWLRVPPPPEPEDDDDAKDGGEPPKVTKPAKAASAKPTAAKSTAKSTDAKSTD